MDLKTVLAELTVAEEVGAVVIGDIAALESDQSATAEVSPTLFGNKYDVTITFTPHKAPAPQAAPEATKTE